MPSTIVVPGKPVGKQRARVVSNRRGTHSFTPMMTVQWEGLIKILASQAGIQPTDMPTSVGIEIERTVPRSWSRKKKAQALSYGWATGKPDIDNVIKAVLDALNGIAWRDDSQVVTITASRTFTERDQTTITIELLGESATHVAP